MSEEKGLIVFKQGAIEITQEQKQTFIGFVSQQNPTEAELLLHFDFCARKGVHPLERLIYFTKRQGKYTPITSIDYMRMRAESSGAYAGSDDAVFKGTSKINNKDYPQSATVTVWKLVDGQRCPFTATSRWQEYAPGDLSENAAFMWRTKPYVMLAKCAEALALRKAFPGQLQGLYTSEEFDRDTPQEPTAVKTHVPHESQKASEAVIEGEVVTHTEAPESPEKKQNQVGGTEMVTLWDGKTVRPASDKVPPEDALRFYKANVGKGKFFESDNYAKNHLHAHFGVEYDLKDSTAAIVAKLSWKQMVALVKHVKGMGDDPEWYPAKYGKTPEPKEEKKTEVHNHTSSSGYSDEYLDKIVAMWAMQDDRVKNFSTYASLPNERKADLMTLLTEHVGEGKTIVDPNDLKTIVEYLEMG